MDSLTSAKPEDPPPSALPQPHRSPRARFLSGPFVAAVVILAAGTLATTVVAGLMGIRRVKEALPLKTKLAQLNEVRLGPYVVRGRTILDKATIESLGTEEYLSWTLEDTSVADDSRLRFVGLLVTFYTGGHNLVPHTPDVCYLGSGYAPAQPHENRTIEVLTLSRDDLPVRVCTFQKGKVRGEEQITVIYTFRTNGQFTETRSGVRLAVNNPFNRYAYFSKVECRFWGTGGTASREESLHEGVPKLFNHLLPLLISDHWPDFEKAEQRKGGSGGA